MTEQRPNLSEDIPASPFWIPVLRFGLGGILLVFFLTVTLHYEYTPDDTYIYLQYARNIASGGGFAFNAGTPSDGVTGPLWVLLIAVGARVGLDPFVVAKTFDVLFASLSVILIQFVALQVTRNRFYSFFAAVFLGFDAWFLRWAGSGMETSMAMFLVLMTAWNLVKRDAPLAAFTAGLLTLVRPEGFLFFLLVLGKAWEFGRDRGTAARTLGTAVTFYSMVVGPWIVYALLTFGTLVPNTFAAKTFEASSLIDSFHAVVSSAGILVGSQALMTAFFAAGLVLAIRKRGIRFVWKEAAPALVVLTVLVGYTILGTKMISRYLLLVIPLIIVYGLWGLGQLEAYFRISFPRMVVILAAAAVLGTVQNTALFATRAIPHMVNFTRGMENCFRPMAYWLRTNADPDAVILARDVGLIGYVSERTVYDTPGLVTPTLRKAFAGRSDAEAISARAYESVTRPQFIIHRAETRETLHLGFLEPIMTLEFPGLGIGSPSPVYYTLYRTRQ